MYKGEYGYIISRRRAAILRTAVIAGISVGLFLLGLAIYKGTRNIFSVAAALGAIPTGLSAVNTILFLKAMPLSESSHDEIERHRGGLLIRYELEMTSYERTWHIGASTVLEKNAIFYTEDEKADIKACEAHIREQLSTGGYGDYTVKVYAKNELGAFTARLDQLEKLRSALSIDPEAIEEAWMPGTTQTPAGILMSISL